MTISKIALTAAFQDGKLQGYEQGFRAGQERARKDIANELEVQKQKNISAIMQGLGQIAEAASKAVLSINRDL